jgi:hypothetical protein
MTRLVEMGLSDGRQSPGIIVETGPEELSDVEAPAHLAVRGTG